MQFMGLPLGILLNKGSFFVWFSLLREINVFHSLNNTWDK